MATSLGEGIGLQAGVEKDWMRLLMQNRQLAAQQDASRARAEEADQEELDKLANDVKVTKVHRWDQQDANNDAYSTFNKVLASKKENPHNYLWKAKGEILGLSGRQQERVNRAKNYYDAEKFVLENEKMGGATNPALGKFKEAITGGKYEDAVMAAKNDPYGILGVDEQTKTFTWNPLPKIDTDKVKVAQVKDPNLLAQMQVFSNTYLPSGQLRTQYASSIPKTKQEAMQLAQSYGAGMELPSIEGITENLLTNIPFVERQGVDYANAGLLNFNGEKVDVRTFRSLPFDVKQQLIQQPLFNDMVQRSGAKISTQTSAKPNQDNGLTKSEIAQGLKNDVKIEDQQEFTTKFNLPVFGEVKMTSTAQAPTTANGLVVFKKPINVTTVLPKGTVDLETNKAISESPVDKNVSLGAITILPIDKKTGAIIPDYKKTEMEKAGSLEYKAFVPAVSVEKSEVKDSQGNIRETNYTKQYYVPAEGVKNPLGQNKIDVEQHIKEAAAKNAALKKDAPKVETKKDWSKYKRK